MTPFQDHKSNVMNGKGRTGIGKPFLLGRTGTQAYNKFHIKKEETLAMNGYRFFVTILVKMTEYQITIPYCQVLISR